MNWRAQAEWPLTAHRGAPNIRPRMWHRPHAWLLWLLLLGAGSAAAENLFGLPLPARTKRNPDERLEVRGTYEATVSFFERHFAKAKLAVTSEERVHRVSVKFTHFESQDSTTEWHHVNVSQYDGKVYVVILPRVRPSP